MPRRSGWLRVGCLLTRVSMAEPLTDISSVVVRWAVGQEAGGCGVWHSQALSKTSWQQWPE